MTLQKSKISKEKFKEQFSKRIKQFVLNLIIFIEQLPIDNATKIIANQLLRSSTSVGANYFEAKSASSKKVKEA